MRLAIISDIHANLEALQAVLDHIESVPVDAVYCLGDVVGYGADPEPCVELIRARCSGVVLGNHDAAVAGDEDLAYLPKDGRTAALAHRDALNLDHLAWLSNLPLTQRIDGCTFVHATPHEPDCWHRMGGYVGAAAQFDHFDTPVCFVGHTHIPGMMADAIGVFQMRSGRRYLINVGSVGQPRDGDPRSAFCIFDAEKFSYDIVRVRYDVTRASQKILDAGLPKSLARRLHAGA